MIGRVCLLVSQLVNAFVNMAAEVISRNVKVQFSSNLSRMFSRHIYVRQCHY